MEQSLNPFMNQVYFYDGAIRLVRAHVNVLIPL